MDTTPRAKQADRPTPRRAFTLIEVLIVAVVLGILALVVIPEQGTHQRHVVENAAKLLLADLEYAQVLSITDGSDPCVLVVGAGGDRYHIARQSDPATPIPDPAGGRECLTIFGEGRANTLDGVSISATTGIVGGEVRYTSLGALLQGDDVTITLESTPENFVVVVDASTGDPSVQ